MGYAPETTAPERRSAFLAGCRGEHEETICAREHLAELRELARTLEIEVRGEISIHLRTPNVRYYVGKGKAEEIRDRAAECNADWILFDDPVGPSQQRNLERLCGRRVIDRQELILDIFAQRAQTREAVLQVELARCRYFLPRLAGAWTHLSRQRGGGTLARGAGEQQIEYDRRQLKARIAELEENLAEVRKQREVQRKERIRSGIPTCAIVGYTNAGKSTLLNILTGAGAFAENKLFATLDPSTRRMILPDKSELLLTDTVGFIRKLPHSLVEAFKATLEETLLADFILLVLDVSSPDAQSHWETSLGVLHQLGASGKDLITVFNKIDLQRDPVSLVRMKSIAGDAVFLSCRTGEGINELKERLARRIGKENRIMQLDIPPEQSAHIALLHAKCCIFQSEYRSDGHFCAVARVAPVYHSIFDTYSVSGTPHQELKLS